MSIWINLCSSKQSIAEGSNCKFKQEEGKDRDELLSKHVLKEKQEKEFLLPIVLHS